MTEVTEEISLKHSDYDKMLKYMDALDNAIGEKDSKYKQIVMDVYKLILDKALKEIKDHEVILHADSFWGKYEKELWLILDHSRILMTYVWDTKEIKIMEPYKIEY